VANPDYDTNIRTSKPIWGQQSSGNKYSDGIMLEPRQLKMSSNFNETFQSAMDLEVNQKEIEEH
jgi:hypothetical protein